MNRFPGQDNNKAGKPQSNYRRATVDDPSHPRQTSVGGQQHANVDSPAALTQPRRAQTLTHPGASDRPEGSIVEAPPVYESVPLTTASPLQTHFIRSNGGHYFGFIEATDDAELRLGNTINTRDPAFLATAQERAARSIYNQIKVGKKVKITLGDQYGDGPEDPSDREDGASSSSNRNER